MFRGYVYMIRDPTWKEGIVKIGMSNKLKRSRLNSYGCNCIYYRIFMSNHPGLLERSLIHRFTEHFEIAKGREYFSGDLEEMSCLFDEVISALEWPMNTYDFCRETGLDYENCHEMSMYLLKHYTYGNSPDDFISFGIFNIDDVNSFRHFCSFLGILTNSLGMFLSPRRFDL